MRIELKSECMTTIMRRWPRFAQDEVDLHLEYEILAEMLLGAVLLGSN